MSNFRELVRIGGKDAVTRFTQGGKSVTGFSAAFDNGWGERKQTIWLDCSLWGERGEKVAPYLTKGALVMVTGNIGTREHEGRTYITLDVSDVRLTAKAEAKPEPARGNTSSGRRQPTADNVGKSDAPFSDDDIPFVSDRGLY